MSNFVCQGKAGGNRQIPTRRVLAGHRLQKSPVGKQPAPAKRQGADARTKLKFQRRAKRWVTFFSSTRGVIRDLIARKILLVVMLNTIVFLSSTLKFGAENVQLGVIGMKKSTVQTYFKDHGCRSHYAQKSVDFDNGGQRGHSPYRGPRELGARSRQPERRPRRTPQADAVTDASHEQVRRLVQRHDRTGESGGLRRGGGVCSGGGDGEGDGGGGGERGSGFTPLSPPAFFLFITWRLCFRLIGYCQSSDGLYGPRTAAATAWGV